MSDETQVVGRRGVLRGGAIAAGVAAGAVIAGATAQTASAANGDAVTVGGSFTGTAGTQLTTTGGATVPTLKLTNATGPTLQLTPVTTNPGGNLALGNILNTPDGPYIGVSDGAGGTMTTLLATGNDLAALPVPQAITPSRVLDTRNGANLNFIVDASSANPFDSAGRLKDGQWLDIAVADAAGDSTVEAAFLNLTVTGSLGSGFVTLCPPGPRPASSTINFGKGQTIANGAFIGAGVVDTAFAVRVYARATTQILLDVTGYSVTAIPGPAAAAAAAMKARRATAKLRPSARLTRVNRPKAR